MGSKPHNDDESGAQVILNWAKLLNMRIRLTAAELVAVIVAVLSAWMWLDGRFSRIETRLTVIEAKSGVAAAPDQARPVDEHLAAGMPGNRSTP